MKYLEWSNPQRNKVEWRLPGAGGGGNRESVFKRPGVPVLQDEKRSVDGQWC